VYVSGLSSFISSEINFLDEAESLNEVRMNDLVKPTFGLYENEKFIMMGNANRNTIGKRTNLSMIVVSELKVKGSKGNL
jgi:hypothetical protein